MKLPFFLRTTPKHLTEEKLLELKEAGLNWIFTGLQSGSDRINREVFKRNVSSQEFLQVANMVSNAGISGYYDIILDNPYETDEDRMKTLKVALSIRRPFQLQLFSLCFYQGTELADKAIVDNISHESPKEKHYGILAPSLHNQLVRMVPTYPAGIIKFLSRLRKIGIIRYFIKLCNLINLTFLEPAILIMKSNLLNFKQF
ncbi:MAG: radical SAM protein [Candidatus Thorarchaeota archaeon]